MNARRGRIIGLVCIIWTHIICQVLVVVIVVVISDDARFQAAVFFGAASCPNV